MLAYYAFEQCSKIKPIMLNNYYAFNIMIVLSKMLLDCSILPLLTALLEYLDLVSAMHVEPQRIYVFSCFTLF